MSASEGYTALLDGYNVIKRSSEWADLPLVQARQRLLQRVRMTRWPVPVRHVTVVFDAAEDDRRPAMGGSDFLSVRFASPSADEVIQQTIRTSPRPNRLLIISDDRAILHTAKVHGALCYPIAWWVRRSEPKRVRSVEESDKPARSSSTAKQIDEELAKRWGSIDRRHEDSLQ